MQSPDRFVPLGRTGGHNRPADKRWLMLAIFESLQWLTVSWRTVPSQYSCSCMPAHVSTDACECVHVVCVHACTHTCLERGGGGGGGVGGGGGGTTHRKVVVVVLRKFVGKVGRPPQPAQRCIVDQRCDGPQPILRSLHGVFDALLVPAPPLVATSVRAGEIKPDNLHQQSGQQLMPRRLEELTQACLLPSLCILALMDTSLLHHCIVRTRVCACPFLLGSSD